MIGLPLKVLEGGWYLEHACLWETQAW